MCGRFALEATAGRLADVFGLKSKFGIEARYNIAPSQNVLIVRTGPEGNSFSTVRWGLLPGWAKDEKVGYKLINARSETIGEKPSFREAFRSRRCLIPATGFYEWKKENGGRQPYYFQMRSGRLFAMAGIWERWDRNGKVFDTCAVITTAANGVVGKVHDRMPVVVPRESYGLWLAPGSDGYAFREFFRPFPGDKMKAHSVSHMVNDVHNEGKGCIRRVN